MFLTPVASSPTPNFAQVSGGTAGLVPFFDGNGNLTENAFFAYDNTNKNLTLSHTGVGEDSNDDDFGLLMVNSTSAGAGNQQFSPMLVLEGQGWDSSGAASVEVQFAWQVQPVQQANGGGNLALMANVADAGFSEVLAVDDSGKILASDASPAYSFANLSTAGFRQASSSVLAFVSGDVFQFAQFQNLAHKQLLPATTGDIRLGSSTKVWSEIWGTILYADQTALGETSTDSEIGMLLVNTTAATSGTQQYSPMLVLEGQGWETTGGSSDEVQFALQTQPVSGAAAGGHLAFMANVNDGGFTEVGRVTSGGSWRAPTSALTASSSVAVDGADANTFTCSVDTNTTFNAPTNVAVGQVVNIYISQTGSFTIAFNSAYKFDADAPALPGANGEKCLVSCMVTAVSGSTATELVCSRTGVVS